MNLHLLCREAGIFVPCHLPDPCVVGIRTDSRKVERGDLFVCIRGLTFDGHQYIKDAVARGAAAIIAEKTVDCGDVPVVAVEDTRLSAAMLYDAWYGHPTRSLKLIAVTGTNGKTSVTYMLRSIFEAAMYRCGVIGTVHCYSAGRRLEIRAENPLANMTTPDPEELYRILSVMASDGVEYVFMEASSHALALRKLDALTFHAAVFTNLTEEHLDFHGNMENYFSAKARLFSMCKRAIINLDDAYGKRLRETASCSVLTCSAKGEAADFSAEEILDLGAEGMSYSLRSRNVLATVHTPIPGRFTVMNTLEAAACALSEGIPPSVVISALGALCGVDGRMERVRLGIPCGFSVFIDYAHTPDALRNLLLSADGFRQKGQRIVVLFGCGGDRDKGKRPVMGRIASELADFSVVTSDNSRSEDPLTIISEICRGMDADKYVAIPSREEAIDWVIRTAKGGDVILLAGKGHEAYEIDKGGKRPFDEREIVRAAVARYHGSI